MTRLITEGMDGEIEALLESSTREIKIISPFIGRSTASRLAAIAEQGGAKVRLITRCCIPNFLSGASSLEGLKALMDVGVSVGCIKGLHTKLYLFDEMTVIIGSSNFTYGGLSTNIELNVLFEGEENRDILLRAGQYFAEFEALIGSEHVLNERLYQQIKSTCGQQKARYEKQGESMKWSDIADIGADLKPKRPADFMETSLSGNGSADLNYCSAWLKFEGYSDKRRDPSDSPVTTEENALRNGVFRTHFSKSPRGIKDGDIMFVARHSRDAKENPEPMIYAYGFAKAWREDQVTTQEEKDRDPDARQWPYFIYLYNLKYINGAMKDCISFQDVYHYLGDYIFPNTVGTGKSISEMRASYSQASYVGITEEARSGILDLMATKQLVDAR
jgi:HKD family nuclease